MRRIITGQHRVSSIAGGLRTPDEQTSGVFSRPASVGRRLLPLLVCGALLLPGCGETDENAGDTATSDDRQAIASSREIDAALSTGDSEPMEQVIPVVDAEAITTLRKEAVDAGKVLVIDCWATWCGSCVAMFPHLHKAMKERGDSVMLVSLTFDEGEDLTQKAAEFLTRQDAWEGALQAAEGSDAKNAIAAALSENWDGGVLPAVFVYKPDGTLSYEMLETRGEVQDWVNGIAAAVDAALPSPSTE